MSESNRDPVHPAADDALVVAAPDTSPYLTLKLARQLYDKAPAALADDERRRVAQVAARQNEIEKRLLATEQAASVLLPESSIAPALAEIRGRYASDADYHSDLARSDLDHATLRAAIIRDLKVEAVLEQVAGRAVAVSDTEVEIYYLLHPERFTRPETRKLRHILLTINDELKGSERAAARARIGEIRARLAPAPAERFAEQALKHSQCPSALQGGLLGDVPRGKLFAEIEAVAFALAAGELSPVVESPMGFHVVYCEQISAEDKLPLAAVRERIREHIDQSRRAAVQKAWLASLFKKS